LEQPSNAVILRSPGDEGPAFLLIREKAGSSLRSECHVFRENSCSVTLVQSFWKHGMWGTGYPVIGNRVAAEHAA
jgi:hypothetical protein